MEWIKKNKDKCILIVTVVFVFAFFAYITYLTPLAGDDWGYAVQGANGNPLALAWDFYFTWSGRFFSELWGFIVAPNKWLWNILNPALFAGIYYFIMRLINPQKNYGVVAAVVLGLMFSVDNTLRIETYTWIMGTTYVVPLFLILFYFVILKPILVEKKEFKSWKVISCIIINFYIGLCMENATAILVLANILLLIWTWFNAKEYFKKIIIILFTSIISLTLLRLSPGANFRLYRDNQEWLSLGLFEQITMNWKPFLLNTFINNAYLLMGLSLIMGVAIFLYMKKTKKWNLINLIILGMNILCLFISLAPKLYAKTNISVLLMFYDVEYSRSALLFCSLFYIVYICVLFYENYLLFNKNDNLEADFYLMLAGTGNLVMLVSPIFGARSSLYTVYFIILLSGYVVSRLECQKFIQVIGICLFALLLVVKSKEYLFKYRAVDAIQKERIGIVEYYRVNQDVEEAWIPRMPEDFIHSADIEEEDIYHMEVFKEYFGLNPDVHLVFFSK